MHMAAVTAWRSVANYITNDLPLYQEGECGAALSPGGPATIPTRGRWTWPSTKPRDD